VALKAADVARLAALARIDLTAAELEHLAPQLDVILDAVSGVAEVKDEDIPPTSHAIALTNVMRADTPQATDPAVFRASLEANAPAWRDDRFVVPRIVEEETA